MSSRDQFNISNGNLKVLETLPILMTIKKYRKQLRKLVIEYHFSKK